MGFVRDSITLERVAVVERKKQMPAKDQIAYRKPHGYAFRLKQLAVNVLDVSSSMDGATGKFGKQSTNHDTTMRIQLEAGALPLASD